MLTATVVPLRFATSANESPSERSCRIWSTGVWLRNAISTSNTLERKWNCALPVRSHGQLSEPNFSKPSKARFARKWHGFASDDPGFLQAFMPDIIALEGEPDDDRWPNKIGLNAPIRARLEFLRPLG